jgi:hypothetical protein
MSTHLVDVGVDPLHHFSLFGHDGGQLREDALFARIREERVRS